MPQIDAAWLALIGALLGGSGLKTIEYVLNRGKQKSDIASEIRGELRTDVKELRQELRDEAVESQKWQDKYYHLFEQYISLQSDYKALRHDYIQRTGEHPDGPSLPNLEKLSE